MDKLNAIKVSQSLHGWCTEEKASQLYDLVLRAYNENIFGKHRFLTVEIGVYGGRSFLPMAFAHKALKCGHCTGLDPYRVEEVLEGNNSPANDEWWKKQDFEMIYKSVLNAVIDNDLTHWCSILRLNSADGSRVMDPQSISILHVDGNHSSPVMLQDLRLWTPKMRPGGYIVFDDIKWAEIQEAYARVPEFGYEIVDDHDQWAIWKKI